MDRIPPAPDAAVFDRNLAALRAVDAVLAEQLARVDLSSFNPVLAPTRDGRTSFRLTRTDGSAEWLGRTSIPAVRAAALLEQFDPGRGNVLLPAMGEGTEVETLLKTLEPHRRVFVWEPEPVTIRLTLMLHDYAADLQAKRLIILTGPLCELADLLAGWLRRHPHEACPSRLMMWPWQTHGEIDEIRRSVEAAWQEASTPANREDAEVAG